MVVVCLKLQEKGADSKSVGDTRNTNLDQKRIAAVYAAVAKQAKAKGQLSDSDSVDSD